MSMYRLVVLGAIVVAFTALVTYYTSVEKEQQPLYVALLFAVGAAPLIVQVFLLDEKSKLGSMTGYAVCVSGLVLGSSWATYTFWIDGDGVRQEGMSRIIEILQWIDLGWSFVLVAFTLHVTALVLKGQRMEVSSLTGTESSLPSGAESSSSSDGTSVRSIDPVSTSSKDTESTSYMRRIINIFAHPDIKQEIQQHPVFSMLILFAVLLHVTYSLALSLALHDQRVMGLYVTPLGETRSVGEFSIQSCQIAELDRLTTQFREFSSDNGARDPRRTVRVVVEGAVNAIDKPMDGFRSLGRDFETHCLDRIIRDLGNEMNFRGTEGIEWLFRTSIQRSGASIPSPTLLGGFGTSQPDRLRISAIYGKDQGARPQLLDYVYFMVYTIVTTGYGDFVPVSPFAKLVCSLANIFEQFFSVIFFGVFLSFIGALGWPGRYGDDY